MNVAEVKQKILAALKEQGEASTAELARALDVTYEAVRQQLKQLEAAELVTLQRRANPSGVGRPLRYYTLSVAGERLFPKRYEALAVALIDTVGKQWGREGLRRVLAAISDEHVEEWAPRLRGKSLEEQLQALRNFYLEDDPFFDVHQEGDAFRLVERNCPYLTTALQRPALCSVTVATLERLLQRRVTRIKRFQDGDGCCIFQVHDEALDKEADGFRFEDEVS